ncbi:MAG: hypothetical protein CMG93_09745 [Marinomonas sp.]|nr:hypothetical protein [Marinomonas sp.]
MTRFNGYVESIEWTKGGDKTRYWSPSNGLRMQIKPIVRVHQMDWPSSDKISWLCRVHPLDFALVVLI